MLITLRESAKMAELVGLLDFGEVDLVLASAPGPDRMAAAAITVAEEEIVLTAPNGHPLADHAGGGSRRRITRALRTGQRSQCVA